jgi:hypothetical protein
MTSCFRTNVPHYECNKITLTCNCKSPISSPHPHKNKFFLNKEGLPR